MSSFAGVDSLRRILSGYMVTLGLVRLRARALDMRRFLLFSISEAIAPPQCLVYQNVFIICIQYGLDQCVSVAVTSKDFQDRYPESTQEFSQEFSSSVTILVLFTCYTLVSCLLVRVRG
ncbi:predicted protein [Histoplasma capsulatum var. duboisii H88]|uniref:Predicted protein n=2 Tax=Ajellomyces capsulatus TaxID=5037 RepID=F0UIL0_AJEC8|nr:predicted protein [Histoplasma capsulatum H143]EGC46409.1 predicted protein [Histoplasma capsulatum var. duboisii H88]